MMLDAMRYPAAQRLGDAIHVTGTTTGRASSYQTPAWQDRPRAGHRLDGHGYGAWKYSTTAFRARIKRLAADLPPIMAECNADFIAVCGSSGIFAAAALQMLVETPICMVRKRGEDSHGGKIEGRDGHLYRRYIVLDDFIDSGSTLRHIYSSLPSAELTGVVCHSWASNHARQQRSVCRAASSLGLDITQWEYKPA